MVVWFINQCVRLFSVAITKTFEAGYFVKKKKDVLGYYSFKDFKIVLVLNNSKLEGSADSALGKSLLV